jgi:hypothetical protein
LDLLLLLLLLVVSAFWLILGACGRDSKRKTAQPLSSSV